MTDKLLNCPFCGGEAEIRVIKPHKHYLVDMPVYGGGAFIECTECTCAMSAETEVEAIERWNTRKPMDRIVEQLEKQSITWKSSSKEWWKPSNTTISLKKAIEIVKAGGKDE